MPVFFIPSPDINGDTLTLTGPLLDHLRKSLRTKIGETLTIGDAQRTRYRIRVTSITSKALHGEILDRSSDPRPRYPSLILAQALLKGDRMDWVIQKATELGVMGIVPVITERVIVRPRDERVESQLDRWQRIALEAAQQSERWDIPTIQRPVKMQQWVQETQVSCKLFLAERSHGVTLGKVDLPEGDTSIVCAIGPEGGWTRDEQALLLGAGFIPVGLGSRILRAETAALAALAILQSRVGAFEQG